MKQTAVFTIASKNYIAHVRTLFESVRSQHNDDYDYYLLLVDKNNGEIDVSKEPYAVIASGDIGMKDYTRMAFTYDIMELNTAVKPFFMISLLKKGYRKLIYLDPDIQVFRRLDLIENLLEDHSVILTPHATEPHPASEERSPVDRSYLISGVFNLGFIAVSNNEDARNLLLWWSDKLATECYIEVGKGLFVDQKWMDLANCFCPSVYVLRHKGCNMAYWNLHERTLDENLLVNGRDPLLFYHFSGLNITDIGSISKYQKKYTLDERKDLSGIFETYKRKLLANGYETVRSWRYHYDFYENGTRIGHLARRLYPLVADRYQDPFATDQKSYYEYVKRSHLLELAEPERHVSSLTKEKAKTKIDFANKILRAVLFLLGPDRYAILMKYLRYISIIRNQKFLLK